MALFFYTHKQTGCLYLFERLPLNVNIQSPFTGKTTSLPIYSGQGGILMIPQCDGFEALVYAKAEQTNYNPHKWVNDNFELIK